MVLQEITGCHHMEEHQLITQVTSKNLMFFVCLFLDVKKDYLGGYGRKKLINIKNMKIFSLLEIMIFLEGGQRIRQPADRQKPSYKPTYRSSPGRG